MSVAKAHGTYDRREKHRFAFEREVSYKLWFGKKEIGSGCGCTLDLSSHGVSFTTEGYIEPGTSVQISISWPILLEGHCPLRLVAHGFVVRSTKSMAACRLSRFDFRTQAKKALAASETPAAAAA